MKAQLTQFIRQRIPVPVEQVQAALQETLPVHLKAWLFCLGGTGALIFFIQAVTGGLLMFYYVPHPDHAYQSIANITLHVRFGWFIRGLHHASAHLMVIAVLLHLYRVFGTRAYRPPREVTWLLGVVLLLTVLGFAFTGYALVCDQLSYWATTVGTNMIGTTPLVGEQLLNFLRGGPAVNPNTLTRFFFLHTGLLPVAITVLIAAHLLLVRLHGVAPLEGDPRTATYKFFPDHLLRERLIGMLVLVGLVTYVIFFPPGLNAPADPATTPEGIHPEWYFYPAFRVLKLMPRLAAFWCTTLFLGGLLAWPFLDSGLEKVAPGKNLGRLIGSAALFFLLFLLVWEVVAG